MELRTGSAESTLDDKGRVSVPIRFREHYQGDLIITFGMERCAWIMTPVVWERFAEALRSSESLNQEERLVLEDKYINQAQVVELDKTGRIAIPPTIRKYANLSKECMVVNSESRLTIWDSETFEAYLSANDSISRAAMNKLGTQDIFRMR